MSAGFQENRITFATLKSITFDTLAYLHIHQTMGSNERIWKQGNTA